jgi:hypothetical protein
MEVFMEIIIKDKIDYEVNLKFINDIRASINDEVLTHDVKISPRDEDFSQYIVEEDENVLLSFSNK